MIAISSSFYGAFFVYKIKKICNKTGVNTGKSAKKYFYTISHYLHGDKLQHFLKTQDNFEILSSSEQIDYIRNLTACYVELSAIYNQEKNGDDDCSKELFKNVYKILTERLALSGKLEKIRKEIDQYRSPRQKTVVEAEGQSDGEDFQNNKRGEAKRKPEPAPKPVFRFQVSEEVLSSLEKEGAKIINILGVFKKLHVYKFDTNVYNYVISTISQSQNWSKRGFLKEKDCLFLIKKYKNITKNYEEFKYDFSIATNPGESNKYGTNLIIRLVTIFYLAFSKNDNDFIGETVNEIFMHNSFDTFGYSADFYKEKYKTKVFDEHDLEAIKKIYKFRFMRKVF